ncbi:hypothetical protein GOP47_0020530 [Adiantum capillus-veneris]|uniref:Uncharacterized protein n=1 Tax=Adiantum capillus-veneris TaxID=13818 RepID=A0A9D4U9J9_ADICA|nr:hypothetical protein GOP47_0020530 [Adiantum capillus-veneris]
MFVGMLACQGRASSCFLCVGKISLLGRVKRREAALSRSYSYATAAMGMSPISADQSHRTEVLDVAQSDDRSAVVDDQMEDALKQVGV